MKRVLFIAVACLLAASVSAQQLKTAQGITIETYTPAPEPKQPKEKKSFETKRGFEQHATVNTDVIFTDFGFAIGGTYTAGYRFNDYIFLGGGTGFGYYSYTWTYPSGGFESYYGGVIPIYAKFRSYFTKTRWKPFFDVTFGMDLLLQTYHRNFGFNNDYHEVSETYPTINFNPAFGLSCQINKKLEIFLSAGYRLFDYENHGLSLNLGVAF